MSARIPEAPETRHGYYEVRPLDVIGREDLLLIDVRPAEDLDRDMGHIEGIQQYLGADLMASGLPSAVDPNTPVVLVCNNGRESRRLAIALHKDHGFVEVYHLVGGMLRWTGEERATGPKGSWSKLADEGE